MCIRDRAIAFAFVSLATILNDPRLDAIGSISIGVVLIVVAIFVAIRIRGLLVGRSAEDELQAGIRDEIAKHAGICLLYTSDAADERSSVDLGGRRIIKKKKHQRALRGENN